MMRVPQGRGNQGRIGKGVGEKKKHHFCGKVERIISERVTQKKAA